MTLADIVTLVLSAHGAILVAASTAYFKIGIRAVFFDNLLSQYRRLRHCVLDTIASDLAIALRPVIRDASRVRSGLFSADETYVELPVDITASESYYQAVSDFVFSDAEAIIHYRQLLEVYRDRKRWAVRLSYCLLALVILELAILLLVILAVTIADVAVVTSLWIVVPGIVPTAIVLVGVITCLIALQTKRGLLIKLEENYDTSS